MTWLVDPATREPVAAIPGEKPRPKSTASHWFIEREDDIPVRMRWRFCDDEVCCPPFPTGFAADQTPTPEPVA